MALYLGIDVGGTNIKGVVVDRDGKIFAEDNVAAVTGEGLADCITELAERLVRSAGTVFSALGGVGVGCPGTVESQSGTVMFAANLKLEKYPLKKLLEEKLGVAVKVCNDANAAAFGEARFGAGKDYSDSITVTLGTGVGGGIIIGGKLFEGYMSAGAEIGHMVINHGGDWCTCGRQGCLEAYCSARALTERTKRAMEEDTSSLMWKTYTYDTCDGRTAFEYMDCDRTARQVANWYVKNLACGLTNLANIFRPQAIILGGGVAAQGMRLTIPLQAAVDKEIFGGAQYAGVKIVCAKLGNKAGALGAAALNM